MTIQGIMQEATIGALVVIAWYDSQGTLDEITETGFESWRLFLWSRGVVPSKSDDIHVGSTCDTRHLDRDREMVSEKYMRKVGAKRKGVSTICALKKVEL